MPLSLCPHAFFTLPDGGKMRYAQFPATGAIRGCVLAVPGRREFIEKKYAELSPLLARGYHLVIVEPRGQGLSSRFLDGEMRQRDHLVDFKSALDDLRAFFAAVVQPGLTAPLILHGHSLGGHMILRWLAEDHVPVTGAFLTAPMLALAGTPAHTAAYGLSWASVRLFNHDKHYAPAQHDYGAEDVVFEKNPLTQDAARFRIIENYFTAFPDLTVGGVTWGWLLASLKSMQTAHAWPYLSRISVPVLALTGGRDSVTPAKEISPYLNMIPRMRTQNISEARHDLLNEIDAPRNECWGHIDTFLTMITPS